MKRSLLSLFALGLVAILCGAGSYVPGVPPIEMPLGDRLPLLSVVPFVALLGGDRHTAPGWPKRGGSRI